MRPWLQPWSQGFAAGATRPLRHNGEPYKGINVVELWMAAQHFGFTSPYWLTFNQARELGGHVRRGEHGSPVVYVSRFKKTDTDEAGEEVEREIPFLRQYTVFSATRSTGRRRTFMRVPSLPSRQ